MEEGKRLLQTAVRRGKGAWSVLAAHRFTTIAGTLVFFLIMSLVPFIFWLTLLFDGIATDPELLAKLELFDWAKELLSFFSKNAAHDATGVSIFFLVTTLWSSTGFFYHLRRSGEILYHYARKKHGWKVRLSALLFTFLLFVFFAVSGALILGIIYITRPLPVWLSRILIYALVLVIGFFTAWLLNTYVCPYRCKPSDTVLGSLFTAFAWLVASGAFALYMRFSNQEQLYGALTAIIVFLLWLYWIMICFTAGVVYNRRRMEVRHLEHKKL